MTLDVLLTQPKNHETIQLIESFLSVATLEYDMLKAKWFYATVLTELGQYDTSNHLLYDILETLKHKEDDNIYIDVLAALLDNDLAVGDYVQAKTHIEQRRRALPILKQYMYYMDLISLAKAQSLPYDHWVKKALEDALPDTIRQQFQIDQLDGYYQSGAYDLAIEMIKQLRMRLLTPKMSQYIQQIELDILNETKHYEAMLEITQKLDYPRYYRYHLTALIGLKKYHQASIFEVEHEPQFESLSIEDQIAIYSKLVELYDFQKDTLSKETYQKKLKRIQKQESIKTVAKPVVETVRKPEIIIEKTVIPMVEKTRLARSLDFEAIYKLLVSSLSVKPQTEVREKIRLLCTEALMNRPFSTILIYHQTTLKMFRKGRLYDKTFEKEDLLKSVIYHTYQKHEDIIEDTDIIRWNYDMLTQKTYDPLMVKRVYSYPIQNGAIAYYQTDDSNIVFYDDYLKLLTVLIEKLLIESQNLESEQSQLALYEAILASDLFAVKMDTADQYTLNSNAGELLAIGPKGSIAEYMSLIKGEDQIKLQQFKQKLSTSNTAQSIRYTFNQRLIEERAIKIQASNIIRTVSLLSDVTDTVDQTQHLTEIAKIDGLTGHLNGYAFSIDFNQWITQKTTFVLVQLSGLDAIESLYGRPIIQAYFKEFADWTKQHFESATLYTIENHQLILVCPFNDVRTVEKTLQTYFKTLKETTSITLHKQPFIAYAGIIRYPISTSETKLDKVLRFLQLALEKAKRRMSHTPFQTFDFKDYQEEQFEMTIIEQMDDAITQDQLKLSYTPIIHLSTNKVFLYQVNPYLDALSVDSHYYYVIAKKRLQIEKLDKHVLKSAFKYLNHLAKKTDKYIRLSISIDEDTFRLKDFNPYVIGLFKQYDLPYAVIELAIQSQTLTPVEWMKTKELADLGIHIGATEWHQATLPSIHFIHRKEAMKLDQLKTLDFILNFKEYLHNHQMGLILESLEEADKKKLKDYAPFYVKEQKQQYTEAQLTALIEGVK